MTKKKMSDFGVRITEKIQDKILLEVFSKQLELIAGHFQKNKTLDWETCLIYLKKGMKKD
jgi:hypothetical protein